MARYVIGIVLWSLLSLNAFSRDYVGGWIIDEHNADNGEFTHCSMMGEYGEEYLLIFGVDGDGLLSLVIASLAWELPEEAVFEISMAVDGFSLGERQAFSLDSTSIFIIVGSEDEIFRRLQKGSQLFVFTGSENLKFPLSGTDSALASVRECVKQNTKPKKRNPFSAPSSDDSDPTESGQRRT